MKTYTVRMNRCGCHPETCCCDDYAVVDERGETYTTCHEKWVASEIAQLLNDKEARAQQSGGNHG